MPSAVLYTSRNEMYHEGALQAHEGFNMCSMEEGRVLLGGLGTAAPHDFSKPSPLTVSFLCTVGILITFMTFCFSCLTNANRCSPLKFFRFAYCRQFGSTVPPSIFLRRHHRTEGGLELYSKKQGHGIYKNFQWIMNEEG